MKAWRQLQLRFRALFQKRQLDAEMDEEMLWHIEMRTHANVEAGMSPEEARYAARRQFGWVESIKETCREQRGVGWIEDLVQDVRYAARMLRKNLGFTAAAVLILGIGIGANSAIFSVVNAVLLRPLPYRDAHRLVQVWETNPRANRWGQWVSYPDFHDWREQNRVFENLAAFRPWIWRITGGDHPEMLRGFLVTSNLFSLLNVQPMFGRSFQTGEDEPGQHPVVILGYSLWQRRFGSDPGLVGQSVTLDGQKHTVIGIMPAKLMMAEVCDRSGGPKRGRRPQEWTCRPNLNRQDPSGGSSAPCGIYKDLSGSAGGPHT